MERSFSDEKEILLAIENKLQEQNERLFLYRQILTSELQCFLLDQKENFIGEKFLIFKDKKRYYFEWSMAVAENSYDGKFEGNILIVGQNNFYPKDSKK